MLALPVSSPRASPSTETPTSVATVAPWFSTLRSLSVAASTVLVGLAAGFFFTYQISVTRGLGITDDQTYVDAFQAINATIRNTWFAIVFFGAIPVLCATICLNWRADRRTLTLIIGATALYLATFAITAAGSVPLNDALALVTERSDRAVADGRADFETSWNRLNLIRTITSVGSLTCLAAIHRLSQAPTHTMNT